MTATYQIVLESPMGERRGPCPSAGRGRSRAARCRCWDSTTPCAARPWVRRSPLYLSVLYSADENRCNKEKRHQPCSPKPDLIHRGQKFPRYRVTGTTANNGIYAAVWTYDGSPLIAGTIRNDPVLNFGWPKNPIAEKAAAYVVVFQFGFMIAAVYVCPMGVAAAYFLYRKAVRLYFHPITP